MAGRRTMTNTANGAATRQRCLDAAAVVLAARGYAGTRLSDIAREARVQAPALYYYFESREALIEEVVSLGQRQTAEQVTAALAQSADAAPVDRIRIAIRAHLESVFVRTSDAVYARAATRVRSQMPRHAQERFRVEHRRYIDLWRTLFLEAAAVEEISSELDPGLARMIVIGAMNWATEWWRPDRGPLENLISTVQTIALRGLGARLDQPVEVRPSMDAVE